MAGKSTEITVRLTPTMRRIIDERVARGDFASEGDLIRAAFRVWLREQAEHEQRLEAIRAKIRRSIEDPRPDVPLDEVRLEMERFFEEQSETPSDATA